jgi:hypothetical protein
MVQRVLSSAAAAAIVVAACGFPEPAPFAGSDGGGSGSGSGDGRAEIVSFSAVANRDVDVLFVMANTPTMGSTQGDVAGSIHGMTAMLQAAIDGLPNLHIGFITSDLGTEVAGGATGPDVGFCTGSGDDGRLQLGQGSGVSGAFVSDVAVAGGSGERQTNYTGDLGDLLARVALQGTDGCAFEQPIAAVHAAQVNQDNTNFLRGSASLAVIVVDDHDDCSAQATDLFGSNASEGGLTPFRCFSQGVVCDPDMPGTAGAKTGCTPREDSQIVTPVSAEATLVLGLKDDPRKLMFGVLAGPTSPVNVGSDGAQPTLLPACMYKDFNSSDAAAYPSVRLASLASSLPNVRTVVQSACDGSLSQQLAAMAVGIRQLIGDPCVDVTLPQTPDCVVDVVLDSDPTHPSTFPECPTGGTTECWDLITDTTHCLDAQHQRFELHTTATLPDDAWVHLRCAL